MTAPTGVGLRMLIRLARWCWPAASFLIGFLPVIAVVPTALAQDSISAGRGMSFNGRVDDGPTFFTIRQLIDRRDGKLSSAEPTVPSWPLRLSSLASDGQNSGTVEPQAAPFLVGGYQLFPSFHSNVAENWRHVQADWARDAGILDSCAKDPSRCPRAGSVYLSILRQAQTLDREAQVELVNMRVNASVRYQSDISRHSQWEVWSSPLKTLGQAGDCEDYAIAKFFLLKQLGIPEDEMRIVLLRDRQARDDHAVLAVRGIYAWHLLDNRYDTLDSDVSTSHYRPLIALNSSRQDLFAAPFADQAPPDKGMALRVGTSGRAVPDRERKPAAR
jgi:predicted transglutaminase-like cysteine proteinase